MTEPPVPPPPGSPYDPLAVSPTLRIGDWLSEAWRILQPFWLESVIAVLVAGLTVAVGYVLCLLPGLVIIGPMLAGVQIYFAKRLLGLPAEIGDVFKGFRRFLDTFLVGLVLYLVPMLINAALAVPRVLAVMAANGLSNSDHGDAAAPLLAVTGCVAGLGYLLVFAYSVLAQAFLIFALPLVLFKGMPALDAMRRSFELVRPQFLGFLLLLVIFFLLGMAAGLAGLILLCVGLLVTVPLARGLINLMQLQAYRDFVGLTAEDLAPYAN